MDPSGCKSWPLDRLLVVRLEALARIKVRESPVIVVANFLSIINPESTMLIVAPSPMVVGPVLLCLQDQVYADPRLAENLGLYKYIPGLALSTLDSRGRGEAHDEPEIWDLRRTGHAGRLGAKAHGQSRGRSGCQTTAPRFHGMPG